MSRLIRSVVAISVACAAGATLAIAQTKTGATQTARGATPAAQPKVSANLLQLMRGIVYPASNVVFAAQGDLSVWGKAPDPSVSPNPLTSTYGGWQAVENASLALAESANLILQAGRRCSTGTIAPVQRADWIKYAQGLRDAGLAAYKAAQSKNQDAMVDAAGTVADACSACHAVYREKTRCVP